MVVVLMGVSGSGKTTIGRILAAQLGWPFYDADDFHSEANKQKMASGIPLDDTDRWPWLEAIRRKIEECLASGINAIFTCSALKRAYRDRIQPDPEQVKLVYLRGTEALIAARLASRSGHFMPPALLHSQFEALEEPDPNVAAVVDISGTPDETAASVRRAIGV